MEANGQKTDPILLLGNGKSVYSLAVCLLQGGHSVRLFTKNKREALKGINIHFSNLRKMNAKVYEDDNLEITEILGDNLNFKLAIAIVDEDLLTKKSVISQLEEVLPPYAIIGINTESISLSQLQENSSSPARIIGVNWTDPAHTTYFLELVTNSKSDKTQVKYLFDLAKKHWNKDPYVVNNGLGIRAKMFAAMIREAFYLVENGYASIEDIDRTCRNDAGYYLPFAGNFRFMDLMGTYAYGIVMKDLNPELSKEYNIPDFFKDIIAQGGLGMENNKGFYNYEKGDWGKWEKLFNKFRCKIQQNISKYPFNYKGKK
jgi:3-hydroxybutyryl-CoA dehydrogenase